MERPKLSTEALAFEKYLLTVRTDRGTARYTPQTTHAYALAMNRALAAHDLLATLKQAGKSTQWRLARNAVLAWAIWKNDSVLRERAKMNEDPIVGNQETKPPSPDTWARIIAAVDHAPEHVVPGGQRDLIRLLVITGLRLGDIFRMTREQATLAQTNEEIVIAQKGRKPRKWPPSDDERNILRALLGYPGWHCLRDVVDPFPPDAQMLDRKRHAAAYHQVRKALHAICTRAGVPYIRPHKYRHAVVDAALAKGADQLTLKELLGHADVRTTIDYYVHINARKQAALKNQIMDEIRGRIP